MKKKILLMVSLLFAGVAGSGSAQAVTPAVSYSTSAPRFEIKDRIENQRERIEQDLQDKTITPDQARVCRKVLDVVARWVKLEAAHNGSNRMTERKYEACNKTLNLNSTMIHEPQQAFFYYDSCLLRYLYWV